VANLSPLPTCGTKFYRYDAAAWEEIYSEDFTTEERDKILSSLKQAIGLADFNIGKLWADQIEDRGSRITVSALGQHAPLEEKIKWDPDFTKQRKIKSILDTLIPEFSVRTGGSTSIDI